ncbi:MAG: ATP-binding protein [Bdellovibrionales bacterium]
MASIKGQDRALQFLSQALQSGRLPSALLFTGPSGVGKKMSAFFIAQKLLCEKNQTGCGVCGSCVRVLQKQHEGLLYVDPEETTIKLEHIQPVHDFFKLRRLNQARIVIIDQAHRMNPFAANALLKVLEEPPEKTHFFLITSQENVLPITIRSRCQKVRFVPLAEKYLQEIQTAPTWALSAAQGRLDLLAQMTEPSRAELRNNATQVLQALVFGSRLTAFSSFKAITESKEDLLFALQLWKQLLRDAWIQHLNSPSFIHMDKKEFIVELTELSTEELDLFYQRFEQMEQSILQNADKMVNLENLWMEFHPSSQAASL